MSDGTYDERRSLAHMLMSRSTTAADIISALEDVEELAFERGALAAVQAICDQCSGDQALDLLGEVAGGDARGQLVRLGVLDSDEEAEGDE